MKKFAFPIFFLILSIHVFGETEMRLRHLEGRMNKIEQNTNSMPSNHYDPIMPHAGPKVRNGMDMFMTLDFIYWKPQLDTLSYSQTGIGNLEEYESASKGQIYSVDWDWDPGFKASYGWAFAHGDWDLNLQYTWFFSNADNWTHLDYVNSSDLESTFEMAAINDAILRSMGRGHANWGLHYQVGDLKFGRNYYVNRSIKMHPFVSIKGTWQKQNYDVFFDTILFTIKDEEVFFHYQMRQDHALWGIGMQAGLDTSWQFTKWFSLYGDISFAGMWIHYALGRKDIYHLMVEREGDPPLTQVIGGNVGTSLHVIKPVFEFEIGLRIQRYIYSNRFHLLAQAGWEAHIWPNQTLYINVADQYNRYDLTLHGLTARFRFDF